MSPSAYAEAPPTFDLNNAPGHLIRRAQQWAVLQFGLFCGEFDLTPIQFAALRALADTPAMNQTSLAQRLALDAATVGSVLLRMENKGWIYRQPDHMDKRGKHLTLSAAGQAHLALATPAAIAAQAAIMQGLLPSEQTELLRLMRKLTSTAQIPEA
jgi:DNA-binding MarR family transcriptional regulator